MPTNEMRQKADELLAQLSAEQIKIALDFLTYLADQDPSELNTQDLMLASETMLAKDWLTPEEDEAWQDL